MGLKPDMTRLDQLGELGWHGRSLEGDILCLILEHGGKRKASGLVFILFKNFGLKSYD